LVNYKVDGLVLKARPFGEADRILTILDPRLGKVEAVAKGARRVKSSLRGACQPFSHNQFFLWQGRSLDGISQCEVVESFSCLRDDLPRMAAASYVAEFVDDVVRERDPSPETYELVLDTFRWLAEAEPTKANVTHILRAFDLRFLALAGFAPSLDACAGCGQPLAAWAGTGQVAFSAAAGGVICPACRAGTALGGEEGTAPAGETPGNWPDTSRLDAAQPGLPCRAGPPVILLSPGTLASMRHLAQADSARARVLRLTPRAAQEMGQALRAHITYCLDRRLKSLDFLDSVLG